MAWDHLDIDKPHLAYMILGGFTSLFMLCSLFVKEKLYIGEATVATLCGIIFGPHAANLFNPLSWGNVDKITLECSRIVLVVQCFAVGVELPKAYMERHWKSVFLLLVPVMTWGWLMTSLFIWWMVPPLNWLESLVCAACVTATDPVLASSVVGKGKFAKRVPKHLRDVLSAESGCNDGMAFPFIYLGYYIWAYKPHGGEVVMHWICITILYECIFGAVYGFIIGYIARHAIRFAENKQLVDRESFLVFYFVLAIFCAGSGSLLGMDDLLIGFSAGVGFSNDGWFTEKTEESHVSNVIDLLLNLAYFVYFGSIVPWQDFNNPEIGLVPWRLVVIAILVIFFRRIPIMLLLKPIIPDIKTWREALFAGHFGPIGVGAVFAAILARAELEGHETQPLGSAERPKPGEKNYYIVQVIWPVTTFLIISSILVHGSSIAVFTLGKRINTMTITLSYTTANEEGPSWMNRLPRMQSLAKGSMSFRKPDELEESPEEYPPGTLPPLGVPGNFLRRVRAEDADNVNVAPRRRRRRRRREDGAGGPISQSAIAPVTRPDFQKGGDEEEEEERKEEGVQPAVEKEQQRLREEIEHGGEPPTKERDRFGSEPEIELYQEGSNLIMEDTEGNVLKTEDISHLSPEERSRHIEEQRMRLRGDTSGHFAKSRSQPHKETEGEHIKHAVEGKTGFNKARNVLGRFFGHKEKKEGEEFEKEEPTKKPPAKSKARSAHAYQFGNTIIVEDEDGEVIKKYTIPSPEKEETEPVDTAERYIRRPLARMGTWFGKEDEAESSQAAADKAAADDDGLRFTVAQNDDIGQSGVRHKGRRMNKQEFIRQIQNRDFKSRRGFVEDTDAPEEIKDAARDQAQTGKRSAGRPAQAGRPESPSTEEEETDEETADSDDESARGHNVAASIARFTMDTPAQARRRRLRQSESADHPRRDSEDDGTERVPPAQSRGITSISPSTRETADLGETGETAVERRRRLAALGQLDDEDSSDSDEPESEDSNGSDGFRPVRGRVQFADGIRPAERRTAAGVADRRGRGHHPRISWGGETGRDS